MKKILFSFLLVFALSLNFSYAGDEEDCADYAATVEDDVDTVEGFNNWQNEYNKCMASAKAAG